MSKKYIKKCPDCGSTDIVPIAYGMPNEKLQQDAYDRKVHLGGCVVTVDENQSDRHCNNCEFEWNKNDKFCSKCHDVVMYCKCYEDMYK